MNSPLHYPDGIPCHAGDLIWFNEGLCVGRVKSVLSCERMRAEHEPGWQGGSVLFVNYGLGERPWGAPYCYDESMLEDEGIARLTSTEELAVELLFKMLGQQLKLSIWDNPQWNYVAWLEPIPLPGEQAQYSWVWNLAFAPQEELEPVQRFRFNRESKRFHREQEPFPPILPRRPKSGLRSMTTRAGETYTEGDLVWQHGRLGVTTRCVRNIIRPGDPEADWINSGRALKEAWVETTDLEREDGGCVESATSFEQECCGRMSPTEELATDLLFHLLEQHPSYPMRATPILRCGLSIRPAPRVPGDAEGNWRYDPSRKRVSIFVCNERDPMLGDFLCYRFKRRSGEFVLETRD